MRKIRELNKQNASLKQFFFLKKKKNLDYIEQKQNAP